jgi:hypothetical protein
MSVIETTATNIETAAQFLGHFLTTTKPEFLHWKPKAEGQDSKTRSAMDVVSECVNVNYRAAAVIKGQPFEEVNYEFATAEEARDALNTSAKVYADTMREQDESIFAKTFALPWGEVSGAFLIGITTANMHYHNGQINYIQCLYGDDVFHRPGPPTA